jgi:hypothetical protein
MPSQFTLDTLEIIGGAFVVAVTVISTVLTFAVSITMLLTRGHAPSTAVVRESTPALSKLAVTEHRGVATAMTN